MSAAAEAQSRKRKGRDMAMILNGPHIVSQPQENEPPPSSCVGRWCSRRMADPWRIAVHESGHCVAAQLYYGTEQERKAAEEQRKQLELQQRQ
jgi:hypothetical protein